MNQSNSLFGLIGQYGYSDDSDEEELMTKPCTSRLNTACENFETASIHPAPVQHCPWSACYDESSGYTYYWNQQTNVVTWDPPEEYLLAIQLARQQLEVKGNSEVSAEEWQLYQQVLADKQKAQNKSPPISKSPVKTTEKKSKNNKNKSAPAKKRKCSDSDDEKIELITSYQHSDSESNEDEPPTKPKSPTMPPLNPPKEVPIPTKTSAKKPKTTECRPVLPTEQNYSVPIGPEMPPEVAKEMNKVNEKVNANEDDEKSLIKKLKDKSKLLEKLGGEIPSDVKKLIKTETKITADGNPQKSDIDDLLQEIKKKELKKNKTDINSEIEKTTSNDDKNSPSDGTISPTTKPLFPSATNIQNEEKETAIDTSSKLEKDGEPSKKKLVITNSNLVEKKPGEVAPYTTKYSQCIEGVSGDRMGLGFNEDDKEDLTSKETVSYGKDLVFTKGETLNEVKNDKEETDIAALEDCVELLEAKLKFLNGQQAYMISPVQEMNVQLQTLLMAYRNGALCVGYWQRWSASTALKLQSLEESAAPPGWSCYFNRAEGRYVYKRECDGHIQWDYPVVTHDDMDICTTPTHDDEETSRAQFPSSVSSEAHTPPPPAWNPPSPPNTTEEQPPLPKDPPPPETLGDELQSFYNDIAEIEKQTPSVNFYSPLPPTPPPPKIAVRAEKEEVKSKKKSKVKISCSIGPKNKSVSTLVAKWQQVADEIHSE